MANCSKVLNLKPKPYYAVLEWAGEHDTPSGDRSNFYTADPVRHGDGSSTVGVSGYNWDYKVYYDINGELLFVIRDDGKWFGPKHALGRSGVEPTCSDAIEAVAKCVCGAGELVADKPFHRWDFTVITVYGDGWSCNVLYDNEGEMRIILRNDGKRF